MIVKFDPATSDRMVWRVSVPRDGEEVPVDYTTVPAEQRSFLGDGGYFEAEPDADGWEIVAAADTPDGRSS